MSKIVVDIETVGIDFDSFSEKQREYLLKYAKDDQEKETVKKSTGLYPLTGRVVAVGMLNPETMRGCLLFDDNGGKIEKFEEDGIVFEAGSEKEILKNFWDRVKTYQQVITFNGRGFDAPYLLFRSAINGIRPTKNLMGYRYDAKEHCDLLDQLTFYGAVRKYNLDFYARAFGIKSSKEEGVDGSMVSEMFKSGKYLEIARYCVRDLATTKELFEKWEEYLKSS